MRADGSDKRQVTHKPGASFAPYFTPDGKQLIYSSNWENPRGRNFDLYLVGVDGGEPEPVTRDATVRRLPDVQPRRPLAGVRLEPRRRRCGARPTCSSRSGGPESAAARRARAGRPAESAPTLARDRGRCRPGPTPVRRRAAAFRSSTTTTSSSTRRAARRSRSLWGFEDVPFHWYRPWSRELHYWTLSAPVRRA